MLAVIKEFKSIVAHTKKKATADKAKVDDKYKLLEAIEKLTALMAHARAKVEDEEEEEDEEEDEEEEEVVEGEEEIEEYKEEEKARGKRSRRIKGRRG